MRFIKLNSRGFAHHALLALVVVGMAATGVYALVGSHAQTPPEPNASSCGKLASNRLYYGGSHCPAYKFAKNTLIINDSSAWLKFQADGNLVASYQNNGYQVSVARWASGTNGKVPDTGYLALQPDGNMVIYSGGSSNHAIWASKTNRSGQTYFAQILAMTFKWA